MTTDYEDFTNFFKKVDLDKVVQGEFLDPSFFEKTAFYDILRYEKMNIGAVAIIVNKDREDYNCILGVSRKNDHLDFGLPGGKSDEGESIIDTLKREVYEETGLVVVKYQLVYAAKAIDRLCFTFICDTADQRYENRESDLGAKLEFIMIGDLFVTNYRELVKIILGKNNWSSELYFSYLNRYMTKHRKSTFCSYNFRAFQKLLDFRTKTMADSSPKEERKAFGAFTEEIRHLFNQALFEAPFLNVLDTEKILES